MDVIYLRNRKKKKSLTLGNQNQPINFKHTPKEIAIKEKGHISKLL